jgi:WD40 repeat protein
VAEPLTHPQTVRALMFSADSQLVLTNFGDQGVQLWTAATGRPVGGPFLHSKTIAGAAFSPDGRWVLTGSADGTARRWQVPAALAGKSEQIKLLLQVKTGMELDESGTILYLDEKTWAERRRGLDQLGGLPAVP